jgi:hypothetical protein
MNSVKADFTTPPFSPIDYSPLQPRVSADQSSFHMLPASSEPLRHFLLLPESALYGQAHAVVA